VIAYDHPALVADRVRSLPRPILIGLDVDGVLAPIVDHADEAQLLDGMAAAIDALAARDGITVAVLSGRAVDDLARFRFSGGVTVVGSHGMETRGEAMRPLEDDERTRLQELESLAARAADDAGEGAWVEHKPASVVVHVRQADPELGGTALDRLHVAADRVAGSTSKAGNGVLELFARAASKGTALALLADRLGAASTVFVGDDLTDEDAFAALTPTDVAIKVGDAPTIAALRLADPPAVLDWLHALVD
jgi:trehalose 6-phosphate phosphatase